MHHHRSKPIPAAAVLGVAVLLLGGCDDASISEKWIGFYTYPNDETKFAIYMDLTIERGVVSGRALDGNMEAATIDGTVDDGSYTLLIHPVKQGSDKKQDLYYRGIRSNDSIVGEWEHVVGVKGLWSAKITDLAPAEALKLHQIPCKEQNVASGVFKDFQCDNDT